MDQIGSMTASGDASDTSPSSNTFSATSRASLPPELWAMTISTMRDRKSQAELAYLWMTVRRVSKQFEWAVEKIFRKEHIGVTRIYADSGNHCIKCRSSESVYCHGLLGDHGQRPFHFSNLDVADENRAIFKYQWDDSATPPPSILEGLLSVLSREDHESAPSTSRKEDEASTGVSDSESDLFYEVLPTFVVQVRSGLVDSEVPALRLDAENREISVDWRNVYTSYFSHCLAGIAQKEIDAALPETSEETDAMTQHLQHLHLFNIIHKKPHPQMKSAPAQWWFRNLQVRAYREACGHRIGHGSVLSAEKLRKRRIADFEVYLDDDGYAMPGNTYHEEMKEKVARSVSA